MALLTSLGVDVRARVSATEIVRAVDTALDGDTLRTWQLYSGVAHGRPWALKATRRMFPEPNSNDGHLRQAINVLAAPTILARSFLVVADLRRRFPRPTSLEAERLERVRGAI